MGVFNLTNLSYAAGISGMEDTGEDYCMYFCMRATTSSGLGYDYSQAVMGWITDFDPVFNSTLIQKIEETYHELDEKYIPDTIARTDSVNALSALVGDTPVSEQISEAISEIPQSDWNQNDETATDYIKNRTHYVTGAQEIETVFENNSLPFEWYVDDIYGYANTVEFPEYIREIYTFKIIWDGVEYTCDRISFGSNYYIMMPTLILGNMAIEDGEYGVDSGEPFCISVDEGTGYMKISTNQAGTTHSLKIVAIYENLKQLSEKFIPGSIARVSDLEDIGSSMFEELQYKAEQTDLDAVKSLVGDTAVSTQISNAVAQKSAVQIITWGADD